jgi:hypothetical protein
MWKTLPLVCLALAGSIAQAAQWTDLMNGKNLEGWEVRGDGSWSVMSDGTLVGQSDRQKPFKHQSWLYTNKEFTEFDLSFDYWMQLGANSGVSVGDHSRARYAIPGAEPGPPRTPARIAYEINLDNGEPVDYDITGSIYLLAKARTGVQNRTDWNHFEMQVRKDRIRVSINGHVVCEHATLPDRPTAGPIGLQLHDTRDVVMFRHIQLRTVEQ